MTKPTADELLAGVEFPDASQVEPAAPDPAELPPEVVERLDRLNLMPSVREEAVRQWVRAEGRRALGKIETPEPAPPGLIRLSDLLAEPDTDPMYRVEGLWPTGGRIVLAAQYKAGKTTLTLNLVRCLVDWDHFLSDEGDGPDDIGKVTPLEEGETVALIDLELDRRTIRRWLRAQNVVNNEAVLIEALRGRIGVFDVLDRDCRAAWAKHLAEHRVRVLILDCLAPLLSFYGINENASAEVGPVLAALDELCETAGVSELLVVHHMGHAAERSRGASRLRDWPDAEWRLMYDGGDYPGAEPAPNAPRFFVAQGRDVAVPERELKFNPVTRRLSLAADGGDRAARRASKREREVLEAVKRNPGATGRDIAGSNGTTRDALATLVRRGEIHTCAGKRGAVHHVLSDGCDTPRDCPAARKAVENASS